MITVGWTKNPRSPFEPPPVSTFALDARSRKPKTRSCWDFEITGPISTSSLVGRVADLQRLDRGHELVEELVVDLGPAITREAAVQSWPEFQ